MGLIGENGAGKSTTINFILNEISKTDGNIEIFGKDYLSDEIEIKDKIGVVLSLIHISRRKEELSIYGNLQLRADKDINA